MSPSVRPPEGPAPLHDDAAPRQGALAAQDAQGDDLCAQLAGIAAGLRLEDADADVRRALVHTLVDTLGVALAAAPEGFARDVQAMAEAYAGRAPGRSGCTVIGSPGLRLNPAGAAIVNGTLGHGWDFDDVHLPSLAHLSTIVIPAALAAAEHFGADGKTFLAAVLAGDEVGGRLGWSVCSQEWGGTAIRNRGFFPTAILGTMAAAAAASRVAGLDAARTRQALAIAASHAAGLACISRGDNSTKRTQAGWAAAAGLGAALLARQGYTGPRQVLETRQGFYEAYAGGHYRPEALARGPGQPWIVQEMSFKAYPLEYIIHPLAELARQARHALGAGLARATRIEASAASKFVTLFEPAGAKARPASPYEALISAPYCIARTLLDPDSDELHLAQFKDRYTVAEDVAALAGKVDFVAEPAFDRSFPLHIGGRLRILQDRLVLWEGQLSDVYGSPDRPMRTADLHAKFHACAAQWGQARRAGLLALLEDLQAQPDASWIEALA